MKKEQQNLQNNRDSIPDIRVIIGLGNPGKQYYLQRHSIGFRVLDALANKHNVTWEKVSWKGEHIFDRALLMLPYEKKIMLIKPQTFMNSSGKIVNQLNTYGFIPDQYMVVHDELELPFGKWAIRKGGSARGHNGLKSLITGFQTDQFFRLRFGIGRPEKKEDVPSYVLEKFREPEIEVELLIQKMVDVLEDINGISFTNSIHTQ